MKTILKNTYFWIAVVAGLVIGDIIGVALFREDVKKEVVGIVSVEAATTSPYSVTVSPQAAGSFVVLSEVSMGASSTWFAVREHNGDLLGRILGARRLDATSTVDFSIELIRATAPHVMYAVVMYADDGDRKFDYKADTLVEANGTPVAFPFTAY